MERQLPKNVRQIGNVSDNPKIYVEDYVDTYLNQLREKAREQPVGVILTGELLKLEDENAVFVSGAVQMKEVKTNGNDIEITDEIMKEAKEEAARFFPECRIVGWGIIEDGSPMSRNREIKRIQEKEFAEEWNLFLWKNAREQEEVFYAYKFGEIMQMGGHYIYYEKNPEMQNYMINTRRENGVTPSEVVEDRAAKDFRSTIKGRMEVREQRRESRYVYLTSVLLVVIVLAIGISTMNNYDKMNSVQNSIETLSSNMGANGSSGKNAQNNQDTQEMQSKDAQNSDEQSDQQIAEQTGQGNQEENAGGTDEASQETNGGTTPDPSTIQEELQGSSEDYYVVQKGDTLDLISKKLYGTTSETDAICRMNGLKDGNLIFIGQKLLLP